jgi:serine/threonine-protein kinase
MKVVLEVFEGPHQGVRLEFDRPATLAVGRGPTSQLQLTEDAHFSRNHFVLEFDPPACRLRDLGSRNGTFVNEAKVTDCKLRHGDVISGGKTRIRITVEAGADDETLTFSGVTGVLPPGRQQSAALPSPPTSPETVPVDLVPGYEIVRTLGRGEFGVAHLARQQATTQLVALKVIVPDAPAVDVAVRQVLAEVSKFGLLNHPHLVRLLDLGQSQGQIYFAEEYVETVDRAELLNIPDEGQRVRAWCGLLCQVLEGLGHAHARLFVHGDVKPSNILVSRSGFGLHAKLSDFGLARCFRGAGLKGLTGAGPTPSTYAFRAPEQVANAEEASPAVDVYGTGASLYHFLSGAYPHDVAGGADPARIAETEPVPLWERRPSLPRGLAEVVHRALARDPKDRFATAAALRQALLPYAEGSVPPSEPGS